MSKKKRKNKVIISKPEFPNLPKLLTEVIFRTQPQLKRFCNDYLKNKGYGVANKDGYLYAEGNIPVMLVAHLDTVHKEPVKEIFISNMGNISSPQGIGGDDRCGVYAILKLITDTNLRPYILFAEDEEIGCVGSEKFVEDIAKHKGIYDTNVNFIIEIDRRGNNDSVYYECDNPEFEKFISSYGFKTDYGSFSDIAVIAPEIGVAAVNLSSGYYNAHTTSEYINIIDLNNIIDRVTKIVTDVSKDKTKRYEYIEAAYSKYNLQSKYYGWDWDWNGYEYTDYCRDFHKDYIPDNICCVAEKTVSNIDPTFATIVISSGEPDIPDEVVDEWSPEACDYYIDEDGIIYLYYSSLDGLMEVKGGFAITPNGLPLKMDEFEQEIMKVYETVDGDICAEDEYLEDEDQLVLDM